MSSRKVLPHLYEVIGTFRNRSIPINNRNFLYLIYENKVGKIEDVQFEKNIRDRTTFRDRLR